MRLDGIDVTLCRLLWQHTLMSRQRTYCITTMTTGLELRPRCSPVRTDQWVSVTQVVVVPSCSHTEHTLRIV